MARKARLEHWRLTGMNGASAAESADSSANLETSFSEPEPAAPAFLSSLPLFRLPLRKTCDKTEAKPNGIQLTWPPPPLPHSPCPSSAANTPVTPTLPAFPAAVEENGHQSPKCFGHQRVFQWPVPALPNKPGKHAIQRNGSFHQEALHTSTLTITVNYN